MNVVAHFICTWCCAITRFLQLFYCMRAFFLYRTSHLLCVVFIFQFKHTFFDLDYFSITVLHAAGTSLTHKKKSLTAQL